MNMLDTETKRRIDTARDILVGKVPDPKSQVEQITIALIYKFMDDMDAEAEELGGKRSFFTGEFEKYGWSKLMASGVGGHEVLNLYAEAITKMNENAGIPLLFRDIFKNAYLPYRNPETLKSFLKIIDDFEYDHSERLGDAFEYLLSVLGSQGDAGQFRTPRHIIDFMVEVIDPKKDDTILDPACGTAGFLISSYKHILKSNTKDGKIGAGLTPDERTWLAKNIKGYDISPDMVRLSLVNLYLHGFTDPHIDEYDALTSEDKWNEYADVILANPPFMSPKGGIKPHKRFSVQSKRSEVLFVDYMAEHLTPNGRAAIIVPEGIIFQSQNAYKQLRKMLVEEYLFAVVSLPAGVFNPYAGVKTSILLMDKVLAKKSDSILFVKIENDGFDLGAQRRPNRKSDLPETVQVIANFKSQMENGETFDAENMANVLVVAKEKIGGNGDWNLSGERYRDNDILRISNYELVELGGVLSFVSSGATPKGGKNIYKNEGVLFIRSQNILVGKYDFSDAAYIPPEIHEVMQRSKVKKHDVFLNITGASIGRSAYFDLNIEANVNQHVAVLRTNEGLNPKYLSHFLNSKNGQSQIFALQAGASREALNYSQIKSLKIPLPPLEIQKEIVAEIEGYQKIIDGARSVVDNYKPHIWIDPEWEVVELGEVSERITKGTTPTTLGFKFMDSRSEINFVKIESITANGSIIPEKLAFISLECHENLKRSQLMENDILFSIAGALGRVGIVNKELLPANTNQALAIISLKQNIKPKYVFSLLKSKNIQRSIESLKVGVAQYNISLKQVSQIKIPLPSLETQNHIVARIENEQALVNANKELITIFEQKIKDKIASMWGE